MYLCEQIGLYAVGRLELDVLRLDLFPLYRDRDGNRERGGFLEMGLVCRGLYLCLGVDRLVRDLSNWWIVCIIK